MKFKTIRFDYLYIIKCVRGVTFIECGSFCYHIQWTNNDSDDT